MNMKYEYKTYIHYNCLFGLIVRTFLLLVPIYLSICKLYYIEDINCTDKLKNTFYEKY